MTSEMAIKMFTILNGYKYNIHFVSMLLSEMVTSAETKLINLYQYTLKKVFKSRACPLDSRTLGSHKLFIINLHLIHCPSNDRLCFSKELGAAEIRIMEQGVLNSTVFLVYPAQASVTENCTTTRKGSFSDSFSRSKLMPDTIISVYPIITHRPFIVFSDFYFYNFTSSSSMDSVLIIESSAYTSSHGQTGRNSLDIASYTMINRREMRTEP